jgi:hypothetical protein
MHLSRDLLDNQVCDRANHRMGKVDGIVLALRRGRPPRVAALELGTSTLLGRISRRLGTWAAGLERRLRVGDGEPQRIDVDRIVKVGINVMVDIDADRTKVYDWERWLARALGRIPGAGSGRPEAERK